MAAVDLLCIVSEERKRFGLRDSDFHRYRIHCTHKLRTLRKSTGLQQVYNPKTKQLAANRPADRLDGIDDGNLKHFLINLFQVEHAWASSRELKEEVQLILKDAHRPTQKSDQSNSRPRTGATRVRHHANNRLTKAIQHSDRFLAACHTSNALSLRTLAQVHVHRLYMQGLLDFELARWDSALDHFALSAAILNALRNSTEQADHKKRAVFDEASDELAPMIRYCAYKTGADALEIEHVCHERLGENQLGDRLVGKDWPDIQSLIESSKQIVQQTIELKWIDKLIPIRNPELVDLVTSLQKADRLLLSNLKSQPSIAPDPSQSEHLTRKQKRQQFLQAKNPKLAQKHVLSPTAALDQAVSTYVAVETSLQALIESNTRALELNPTIQRFDQQSTVLATIHSIVGFRLLSTRVNRDVELVHKLEKKLARQEARVDERIGRRPKNYQQINRLVLLSSHTRRPAAKPPAATGSPNHPHQTAHVKALLVKRRQAKVFPSLLKLFDDILFNLERIKQLKLVEDSPDLSVKIDCKVSFFKAYRSLVQAKSYLLVDKHLESYVLQQKSSVYLRQTTMNLAEVDEQEEDGDGGGEEDAQDLDAAFLRFPRGQLRAVSADVQARLHHQIVEEWWTSDRAKAAQDVTGDGETMQLAQLSLADDGAGKKMPPHVFDLAFNYVTQLDWARLDPSDHPAPRAPKTQQTSTHGPSPPPTNVTLVTATHAPPLGQEPPQKAGGLWSFFRRG